MPIFRRLRKEYDRPSARLLVGIPFPFDIAYMLADWRSLLPWRLSGPPGDRRWSYYRPIEEATLREIHKIHALAGDNVLFQVELPGETALSAQLPLGKGLAIRAAADAVTRFVARMPRVPVRLHYCYGNFNNLPAVVPSSTRDVVRLANSVTERWPGSHTLDSFSLPIIAGGKGSAAPVNPAYYTWLSKLSLPAGVRLILGMVHEYQSFEDQRLALQHALQFVKHDSIAVSAACGLGRRTVEEARLNTEQALRLAGSR